MIGISTILLGYVDFVTDFKQNEVLLLKHCELLKLIFTHSSEFIMFRAYFCSSLNDSPFTILILSYYFSSLAGNSKILVAMATKMAST